MVPVISQVIESKIRAAWIWTAVNVFILR